MLNLLNFIKVQSIIKGWSSLRNMFLLITLSNSGKLIKQPSNCRTDRWWYCIMIRDKLFNIHVVFVLQFSLHFFIHIDFNDKYMILSNLLLLSYFSTLFCFIGALRLQAQSTVIVSGGRTFNNEMLTILDVGMLHQTGHQHPFRQCLTASDQLCRDPFYACVKVSATELLNKVRQTTPSTLSFDYSFKSTICFVYQQFC